MLPRASSPVPVSASPPSWRTATASCGTSLPSADVELVLRVHADPQPGHIGLACRHVPCLAPYRLRSRAYPQGVGIDCYRKALAVAWHDLLPCPDSSRLHRDVSLVTVLLRCLVPRPLVQVQRSLAIPGHSPYLHITPQPHEHVGEQRCHRGLDVAAVPGLGQAVLSVPIGPGDACSCDHRARLDVRSEHSGGDVSPHLHLVDFGFESIAREGPPCAEARLGGPLGCSATGGRRFRGGCRAR